MDALMSLFEGFSHALTPMNLLWVLVGCFLGTAVGVLPGLGSSMAVALLLPMTFALDPTGAFIMFAGVYFGGLFGDSTMAILMNTPGQASAIASTFEGHKMAKAGRAPQALATAAIGAFIGGFISCFLVVFVAPALADLSTSFGPAEFFALALFAFVATSSVVADSVLKGLMALVLGIGISVIGIDSVSGTERFTFGVPELFDGVSLVTVTVGILALGEVFFIASRIRRKATDNTINASGRPYLSRKEFGEALPAWLRGTAIGLPFGVIPVGGADVPTFMAYGLERKLDSRRKDPQFGKGAIRGLAGPEAAVRRRRALPWVRCWLWVCRSRRPLRSCSRLSVSTAFSPVRCSSIVRPSWCGVCWRAFFLAMIVLLAINLPFAPLWAKLLKIPDPYLYGGIAVFCGLGIYATSASTFELLILLGIGVISFVLKRYGVPLAPLMIGMVLGPLAESNLRDALLASGGDAATLVSSPITIVLYIVLIGALVYTGRRPRSGAPEAEGCRAE
jgi:putative tricarboxylic transport membrane protein